jgi:hypothetical protein
MEAYVFVIIVAVIVLAALYMLAAAGVRNGDRPGDARVSAVARRGTQPDEPRPVLVAVVRNPSGSAVLAGLGARRAWLPAWVADPQSAGAPLLTRRRKFRPGRFDTVGVVEAGGAAELAMPAPPRGRRWLLTVVVGQPGGRLRVHRLRLAGDSDRTPRRDVVSPPSLRP